MNINSPLIEELRDRDYRAAYVASQIKIGLPFQARALRLSRGWTQERLAIEAGMSQPRIAEIEKPGKRRFNLETLLRIAAAHDVGLEVRFVPISQLVDDSESFDPEAFEIKSFEEELREAENQEKLEAEWQEQLRAASLAVKDRARWNYQPWSGLREVVSNVQPQETTGQLPLRLQPSLELVSPDPLIRLMRAVLTQPKKEQTSENYAHERREEHYADTYRDYAAAGAMASS